MKTNNFQCGIHNSVDINSAINECAKIKDESDNNYQFCYDDTMCIIRS